MSVVHKALQQTLVDFITLSRAKQAIGILEVKICFCIYSWMKL